MQTNTEFPTYVFATVNPGRVQKVVEELKNNSQIDMIAPVTGRYDLALRLKSSAPNEVYNTVNQIRSIADVRTTTTHTAMDGIQPTKRLEAQQYPRLRRSIRSTGTVRHCSPLASKDDRRDHEDLHQPAYECWGPLQERDATRLRTSLQSLTTHNSSIDYSPVFLGTVTEYH